MSEHVLDMRRQLRPLFEMLKHKKRTMDNSDWKTFVKTSQSNILKAPDEYLINQPPAEALATVVDFLFTEFLEELN